jgi:membrane associated rhomboid family serine protease
VILRPVSQSSDVPTALWALVGAMALIEILLTGADRGWFGLPGWRSLAFVYGAFWQPLIDGAARPVYPGQTTAMFLTHALLHGGLFHLMMNGIILLALGKFIAEQVGAAALLVVFFVSAVAGGAVFGLINTAAIPMIGASGAVFGFIGLWQYWEYAARRAHGLPLGPVLNTLVALAAINVVLMVALGGGLAWQAHLGGFLAGWVLGPVMTGIARRKGLPTRHPLLAP